MNKIEKEASLITDPLPTSSPTLFDFSSSFFFFFRWFFFFFLFLSDMWYLTPGTLHLTHDM